MNSASNVSLHQGTTSLPEKSEGRGSAEKPSEGAVGGRSVSSVADDDTLAIVSAGQQNAGITEESARRTLSRRDAAQRAPSGVVLTMPVDRTAAVQQQLQCELEIVNNLISGLKISGNQAAGQQNAGITEKSAGRTLSRRDAAQRAPSGVVLTMPVDRTASVQQQLQCELEIVNNLISGLKISENQAQAGTKGQNLNVVMRSVLSCASHNVMRAADDLKKANGMGDLAYIEAAALKKHEDLKIANQDFLVAFDYIKKSGDIDAAQFACGCRALIQFFNRDEVNALRFFQKGREFGYPIEANHPESLLIQGLALGIGVEGCPSVEYMSNLFQPEFFYDELQEWMLADETKESGNLSLRDKGYRNGARLLFESRGLSAVERCDCYIAEFIKVNESKLESDGLGASAYMLKFAENLKLINEGYLDEALKNVERAEKSGKSEESEESEEYKFKYLDEYIRFLVLKKTGKTDQAIEVCKQGVAKGYPFSKYLSDLVRVRKKPVYV